MARVFITGSADGLGLMAGQLLLEQGHQVVLHARSESRAQDAKNSAPGTQAVVVGDVSTIAQMLQDATIEACQRLSGVELEAS